MPGVGHREPWDDTGSGESSGECDDEDGCEGSGESVASPRELTTKSSPSLGLLWLVCASSVLVYLARSFS